MKKLFIYPPESATSFLFRKYSELLKDYILVGNIGESDTVLFADSLNSDEAYLEIVQQYASSKDIFSSAAIQLRLSELGVEVRLYEKYEVEGIFSNDSKFHRINLPVISVMSLGEYCDKFSVQLAVKKYFQNKGYNVLQFGSSELSPFFGIPKLPLCLYEKLDLDAKVKKLNQYIHSIITNNNYDLVLIGAPGGIVPYNKYVSNHFGELASVIAWALQIDVNIISLYMLDSINDEMLDKFFLFSSTSLNAARTIFNISGTFSDFNRESMQIDYLQLDKEYITKRMPISDKYYIFSESADLLQDETFSKIEDFLTSNIEVI